MNKQEILSKLKASFDEAINATKSVGDTNFNVSKNNKWTAGENMAHLGVSAKMTTMAYTLPKFVPALLYGKTKDGSRTYQQVVDFYLGKLNDGAKANGVYVPAKTDYNKQRVIESLTKYRDKMVNAVDKGWNEEQLDTYRIAHPVLGKLTARELLYFTIYHNGHHAKTIKWLYA
ncbi:MAG: DinB family protein [Chitinophagales bacterium]